MAAAELGSSRDPGAVGPLVSALRDPDQMVRERVVEALARLGDRRAVEPLIAALKDRELDVRPKAAWALGELGDARAVEPLIAALRNRSRSVRSAAAGALGRLGDTRAVEPLIAVLVAALKDRDPGVRSQAAWALGRLGDTRAVEPLIAVLVAELTNPDRPVREAAAELIDKLGAAPAAGSLIGALGDGLAGPLAARLLGKLGAHNAVTPLVAGAVEPLIAALKSSDAALREAAAAALGQLPPGGKRARRAVEPLIAAALDENPKVRGAAMRALRAVGGPEARDLRNDPRCDIRTARLLVALGGRSTEPLIALLGDEDVLAGGRAAVVLAELGGERADKRGIESLIAVLGYQGPASDAYWLRERAAELLAEAGDTQAVEPLIAALGHDDEAGLFTQAAARALVTLADESAIEPLIAALGASRQRLRRKTGSRRASLTPRTEKQRQEVCIAVARALGKAGDQRAAEPLTAALTEFSLSDDRQTLYYREGEIATALESALQAILERWQSVVDADVLLTITALKDIEWLDTSGNPETRVFEHRRVNYDGVRQLARQELTRRGLRA